MLAIFYRNRRFIILLSTVFFIYKYFISSSKPVKTGNNPIGPINSSKNQFQSRIVAVGDLHGDLNHAVRVLRLAELIDLRNQWIGQTAVLVQTGDIVDRGKDTILLYKLMDRLRTEANLAGGAVVSLLGNHEYMNALGDWRYVTKEDVETFGSAENRRKVISTQGWIGQTWLTNYSVTARVPYGLKFSKLPQISSKTSTNQKFLETFKAVEQDPFLSAATVFVHGGITPDYASRGISEINRIGQSLLHRALDGQIPFNHLPPKTPPEEVDLYAEHGPLWERSYALEQDESLICHQIENATQLLHVRRMVMGHTPQFKGITSRCGGKILLIDTGISSAYGGPLTALEINYSLTSTDQNGSESSWNEEETVFALEELKPKKKLSHSQRLVNL